MRISSLMYKCSCSHAQWCACILSCEFDDNRKWLRVPTGMTNPAERPPNDGIYT